MGCRRRKSRAPPAARQREFDAATIRDAATYATPTLPAAGIDAVIVNGAITWQHGVRSVHSGSRNGQVVTRTSASATGRPPGVHAARMVP